MSVVFFISKVKVINDFQKAMCYLTPIWNCTIIDLASYSNQGKDKNIPHFT